jgi:eukaryotic-like serine/threonine-protein kinase
MKPAAQQVESILAAAVEMDSEAERRAFVGRACAGDAELQSRVEELIANYFRAGNFLESPAPALAATAEAAVRERPGTVVGPYKLLEQIGEGGFGVVFMAEQTEPVRRRVALKVLKPGMDSRQVVARFEAERQALALMDHPHIARVFDGGETATGRPFFVMELVRGIPITEFCDQNHLGVRERLELFLSMCQAVQHAHQKGLIHRDLKPGNVLVTLHDDRPVVKVIDFGIAKALGQQLTDKTLFTNFAQLVGTPLYMSPEQAQLSGLDVDTRSDIYALGVLLYELLTGTTPLDGERLRTAGYDEIRRAIREEEPPKPSTRVSTLGQAAATVSANRQSDAKKLSQFMRGELDWIVMKALEKDRTRRYESASAFAADVQRYLHDEPVLACPPSAMYRFRKFARRNKAALATASVVGLAVVVLATSLVLIAREHQAAQTAQQAEARAEEDRKKAVERERRESYFHRITLAHRDLALDLLAACPEDLREWEWHYLMRLCRVEPLVIRDTTEINGVAFSPDGEQLASAGGDGTVKIWNSTTGQVIQTFQAHSDLVVSVAFHPDGKHLASRGADLTVKVWDLTATGQPVLTERCTATRRFGTAYTVAFSPDGRQLAAGTDGVVKVWDWKTRQLLHSLPGHNFHSIPVAFSGDGRLATGSFREDLKLWNPETGRLLGSIHAHDHPVSALAFSPDGKWLASASFGRTVKLSDATTGALLHTLLHTGNVECVTFSRNGRRLASGGEDKTVRIWDATTGREILGLHGHTERCGCVAFSPDGHRLASASSDRTIRIWDGTPLREDEGRQETRTFTEHGDEIRSVAFSPDGPDGQRIASAGHDGLVKVWDAQTGRVSAEFSGHEKFGGQRVVVFCLAWHPKGHLIASVGFDTVRVWDARTTQEVFRLPAALGKNALPYNAVAFSPDGRYLVTGKGDGTVRVWDGGTGREVGMLDTLKREIRGLVFSPKGGHLASASSDGIVKLWDATRLNEKQEARLTLRARVPGPSVNVAFSPDGRRLVTGGEENTVKIWDVETGQELHTLRGHGGEVYTLAISPDAEGRWIASAGEDSTVKVWDSHTGKVRTFRGHRGLVSSVAFSPDGRRLASGSRDKTVKVWDLTQLSSEVGDR